MLSFVKNSGKGLLVGVLSTAAASQASADVLTGKYSVYNDTSTTQEYSVTFTRDLSVPLGECVAGGTISGSLVDLDGTGAFLSAVPGSAIYSALIDGQVVAGLLTAPFMLQADPFFANSVGPVSFGAPIPSLSVGPVNNNFQIVLRFLLSSGDSASFNSNLVVVPVPAPGALALAAASGVLTGRRRRRTAAAASVAGALAVAGPVMADGPALTVDLNVSGASNIVAPTGIAVGAPGTFQYNGNSSLAADHNLVFNLIGTDVLVSGRALIGGSLTYTNSSLVEQWVAISLRLPTSFGATTTMVGGSVAGSFLADANGGSIQLLGDTSPLSLWNASFNASEWNMGSTWSGISVGAFGSSSIAPMSFGLPGPSMPGPALGNENRLNLSFRITSGDTVSFSTSFLAQPIPAPGALAMFACAALGRRRRR